MIKVSKTITINGVEVTMLFTPRLFVMADDKAIKLEISTGDIMHTLTAYADICYCAALNSWTMDNDIDAFPFKRADFHIWAAECQTEFCQVVAFAMQAITGKTLKKLTEEQKHKSEEDVKKKSIFSLTTMRLKHS